MRLLQCVIAITLSMVLLTAGQTGKIAGRVTDSGSGEPLVGCNVLISGTSSGAATDANGEYFIINLSPGSYDLAFSMIGYASYTAEGVQVNIDVTTPVNAALITEALQMTGVSVTAERPAIENTLTSTKHIVSGDLATSLGVTTVEDIIKTLPGITVEGGKLHLRGGRSGEEMFLVDGASIMNPIMGGEAIPVNPHIIGELQLITGTFNAEYGQAMSGLFNTVLKEAVDGVHINYSIRTTSGDQDYFRTDGGTFKNKDVYSEVLTYANSDTTSASAIDSGLVSKSGFGGSKVITDATLNAGLGNIGIVVSMRQYDDPGRLPGMAEDYSSVQSKLTYQLGGNLKLGAEMMTYNRTGFYDPSYEAEKTAGASGDMSVWNWTYALDQFPRTEENTFQWGLSANYVVSSSTNLTLRVNALSKTQVDGAKDSEDHFISFEDTDQLITPSTAINPFGTTYSGADGPDHTRIVDDETNSNAWFGLTNVYGQYFESIEKHSTYGIYVTDQTNSRHLLKVGFEYRDYDIYRKGHDVWFGRTVGYSEDLPRLQNQNITDVNPFEAVAYIQDQMEFNDMILNVGLRYDAFNVGADNGVWDKNRSDENMWEDPTINPFDPTLRRPTTTKSNISPRLGVSFPLGDNMAFRYAYGTFFQRPTFYDLLENYQVQMDGGTESGYFVYIGNPNLDPQETTIYEMGLQYSLGNGLKLDLSGYYKDIAHLTSAQEVFNNAYVDNGYGYNNPGSWSPDDPYQATHFIYKTSEHFGNVRGLEVSVSKSGTEDFTGRLSGSFSIARGTASDKFSAGSLTQMDYSWTGNILSMTTLDWHRPMVINGYLDYHSNMSGMINRIGGNITFNVQSGLPVTARSGFGGAALAERAPTTMDVNLRVDAKMDLGTIRPTVYLLIENVMNQQNVVAIADPSSYFDGASAFYEVAGGPNNNLMAYGLPMTMNIGISIDY